MTSHQEGAPAPGGLTIGELAGRTGLTPETLRMWETRHGFPHPRRLGSGHRRYDEHQVDLVNQVLRRKEAGVRLDRAIAGVVSGQRPATGSVFAELRRAHPHLAARQLRKSTLLALTRAMEDESCALAQRPSLFGAFQHGRYYRRAEPRWDELGRTARRTVVFADFEPADDRVDEPEADGDDRGPILVHLPDSAPMRREWTVVCDAVDHPTALTAWELPGQIGVREGDRMFESLWTLEPAAVRNAARVLAQLAEQTRPDLTGRFADLDEPVTSVASEDLRFATGLFDRLLAYVDSAG